MDFVRGPGNPKIKEGMPPVKLERRTARRGEVAHWVSLPSEEHFVAVYEIEGRKCVWKEVVRLKEGDVVMDAATAVAEIDLANLGVVTVTFFFRSSFGMSCLYCFVFCSIA